MVGGSACPPALMHAFHERGVEIIHAWGMTEMSPLGSVSRPPAGVDADEAWKYRYTQGRVPAGVAARIVGPSGDVMPNDNESVGELEVRGPWVTQTYIGDAEPDPEKFRDGWLRTGDVGMLSSNGFLTLTDRAKDVIKSGGEWISSVDLENHLMAHPAVLEAAVVGVPDDKWTERPLATVVVKEGATVTAEELRDFLGRPDRAVATAGAVGVHRRGAQDVGREVRQEGDPVAVCGRGSVREDAWLIFRALGRHTHSGRSGLIPACVCRPEALTTARSAATCGLELSTFTGTGDGRRDAGRVEIRAGRVVLREVLPGEAGRLVDGGPRDRSWADGYPLAGTIPPARAIIAQDHDGQWRPGFGMYQIVLPASCDRAPADLVIGDIGFHTAPSVRLGRDRVRHRAGASRPRVRDRRRERADRVGVDAARCDRSARGD